ncbi:MULTISPECIES: hypothetical protein [Streptomyces]|uniref:Uncharacterized protein n=1 Tax=Streptomyces canarius TaxID=285453 RepID=A0ABQ3CNY1_9ACTN|nr:hypothetical protein [Streptomyces canarius]GHA28532.1 hypothetical protein GCM10010345_36570 [Streptomyces canarius]
MVEQRRAWEAECGRAGRPVRPAGVDELVAEGRALALRGEADAALAVFDPAADNGSGTGQYLRAVLDAFLHLGIAHFTLGSDVPSRAHVAAAVGQERMRAEVVPLYLRAAADASGARPDQYTWKVAEYLPETGVGSPEGPDTERYWRARREAFVPPVLSQPPASPRAGHA